MWIIFISIGAVLLLIGLFLIIFSAPKPKETTASQTVYETTLTKKVRTATQNAEELQQLIDLAIADGQVTPNEKAQVLTKAEELNIPKAEAENRLLQAERSHLGTKEVELIDRNKEAGDLFEEFIAAKVDRNRLMDLINWQGDKNINTGIYVEATSHPDLHVKWEYGELQAEFAIECKYRSHFFHGGFELEERKYLDYHRYSQDKDMPVFIALGIGGKPDRPMDVYLAPLSLFAKGKVTEQELHGYKMHNPNGNLFYSFYDKTLRQTDKQKING